MSTLYAAMTPPCVVVYGILHQYSFMDLLKNYCSDYSSSEEAENTSRKQFLHNKDVRSVYLVTYSQADTVKFLCREDFAQAVVSAFSQGKATVLQWCCCRENHKNSGEHYHLALKLDRNQCWLSAKQFLLREYSIVVNFSNAWRYVTKSDNHYHESAGHPYLGKGGEPKTASASLTRHTKKRKTEVNAEGTEVSSDDEELEESTNAKSGRQQKEMPYAV